MTTYHWKSATSADWGIAADWDKGSVPTTASADAVIAAAGTYVVTYGTLDNGDTLDSLTLGAGGATLDVGALLTLAGSRAVDVAAGTLALVDGADLVNAKVTLAGGVATFSGTSTLSGDSFAGRLALDGASVVIENGLTLTGPGGTGAGTLDLLASGSSLATADTETLDNATILVGASSGYSYISGPNVSGDSLTFGANAQVVQREGYVQLGDTTTGSSVVNNGSFSLAGGTFYDYVYTFSNTGSIALSNDESFYTAYNGTLTNSGSISVSSGATLDLASETFVNTGTVTLAAGAILDVGTVAAGGLGAISNAGTIEVGGSLTLASFASVTGGGVIDVTGTLDLGGGTLDILAGSAFGNLEVSGDLVGGTLKPDTGTYNLSGATLDGDTVLGPLAVSSNVYVEDGLTVETAAGGLPGSISLTASGSLNFQDSETLDNVSVAVTGNGNFISDNDGTLTLGSQATLTYDASGNGYLEGTIVNQGQVVVTDAELNLYYNGTLTNAGTITATGSGEFYEYGGATFTNSGLLAIEAGATADLAAFSNTGSITVAAGATLELTGSYSLDSLGGIAVAPGGVIDVTGTLDFGGGTLDILAGSAFGNLEVSGDLVGGTLKPDTGTYNLLSGATLDGDTVLGPLAVSSNVYVEDGLTVETAAGGLPGSISLTASGNLNFQDSETLDNVSVAVTGNGSFISDNDGTLTLGSQATLTYDASGNGYLEGTIVNQGQVVVTDAELNLYYNGTLTNAGTITATGSAEFYEDGGATFTNSGLLAIGAGATADLAAFSNTGSITVAAGATLELTGSYSLDSLGGIAVAPGGVIDVTGTLDFGGGTLTLGAGSTLLDAGTILNGTIIENGGAVDTSNSGTLDDVTVFGSLDIQGAAYSFGGLSVLNTSGTAAGTLNLATGGYNTLYVTASETLDNMTILVSSNYSGSIAATAGGVGITFGPNSTIVQTSGSAGVSATSSGDAVTLQGTMDLSGGTFAESAVSFEDAGSIALSGGETFTIDSNGVFVVDSGASVSVGANTTLSLPSGAAVTNLGVISVAAGARLTLDESAANFTNSGTISLDPNASFELDASATLGALGTITGGGTLVIDAGETLDLGGGTLELGAGQAFSTVVLSGTITDGTIEYDSTGALINSGGTITSNVTVQGTDGIGAQTTISGLDNLGGGTLDIALGTANSNVLLDGTISDGTLKLAGGLFTESYGTLEGMTVLGSLSVSNALYISDGLTVKTAAGGLPGSILLADPSQSLIFLDSETLDNVSVAVTGSYNDTVTDTSGTLTLGSHATLTYDTTGEGYLEGSIVNRGQIAVTSGVLYAETTSLTNAGTITATGSADFYEDGTTFTNSGLLAIGAGATAYLTNSTSFSNTGTVTVAAGGTLDLAGTYSLAALGSVVVAPGGLVDLTGTLDLGGGTLDILAGSAFGNLEVSGDLVGGTLKPDTGTYNLSGATLDGDTVLGPLAVSSTVYVEDGLTVETAAGGLPGSILLADPSQSLIFLDSETLDNVSIAVTGSYNDTVTDSYGTLTLGSHATLTYDTTDYGYLYGSIVNQGQISVTSGELSANPTSLTNAGTITATGSAEFFEEGPTFTNTGLLAIGTGATAYLSNTTFSNTGTITVADGATLELGGSFSLASLGSIVVAPGGLLELGGTLNLGGSTLDVLAGSAFGNIEISGDLAGGTLKPDTGTYSLSGATLDGDTVLGSLTLNGGLYVEGGLTVETAAGGLPGSILLADPSQSLIFLDSETLDNVSVAVTGSYNDAVTDTYGTLTLGSHATLTYDTTDYGYLYGSIVNRGQIAVTSGVLYAEATSLTNAGTITATGSAEFYEDGTTFTNSGLLAIGAGATRRSRCHDLYQHRHHHRRRRRHAGTRGQLLARLARQHRRGNPAA